MNSRQRDCNKESLVAYLYGECGPLDREAIEAHLVECAACAGELEALGGVRTALADWHPPVTDLGFRLVRTGSAEAAVPTRQRFSFPRRWALAAAAVLLAAGGAALANLELHVGGDGVTIRTGWDRSAPPPQAQVTAVGRPWRADLVALERQLRAEVARVREHPAPLAISRRSGDDPDRILQRTQRLIDESERRQQRELALRVTQLTRELEAQRQGDLLRIREGFGTLAGMTGAEVTRQRELMNYLIRVSQRE